jgi:hypothetical protein
MLNKYIHTCICVSTQRHRYNATGFSRKFVLVYRFTVTQGISVRLEWALREGGATASESNCTRMRNLASSATVSFSESNPLLGGSGLCSEIIYWLTNL